ncbi:MAG TPA: hypothetical protein VIQ76_10270 [Propionibacteriaceae bacterium]
MAMQIEGPDKGSQQQPAVGSAGVHGVKIATAAVSDHESFRLNGTLDRIDELELRIDRAEMPGCAAKRVVVEQQVETRARPKL